MKISVAIKKLEIIKSKHGDVELHLEVGENQDCKECGEPEYKNFCGTCKEISIINIHGIGTNVWLIADRG